MSHLETITSALSAMVEAIKASALEAVRDLAGRVGHLESLDLETRLDDIEGSLERLWQRTLEASDALEARALSATYRLGGQLMTGEGIADSYSNMSTEVRAALEEALESHSEVITAWGEPLELTIPALERRLDAQVIVREAQSDRLEALEASFERLYEAPAISDALTRLKALEEAQDEQAERLNRYLKRLEEVETYQEEVSTPALDALDAHLERELRGALYSVGGGTHETGAQILASNDNAEAPEVRAALEAALRGASGCEAPWGEDVVYVPLQEHVSIYGPWIGNLEDRLERYARATVEDAIEGRPLKGERLTISLALSDLQRYFAEASPRPQDQAFEIARRALSILTDTLEE